MGGALVAEPEQLDLLIQAAVIRMRGRHGPHNDRHPPRLAALFDLTPFEVNILPIALAPEPDLRRR